MQYNHTATVQTTGLPKALRYANIEGSEEQMILVEETQYNMVVITPENVLLFDGKAKVVSVKLPESPYAKKGFQVPKSNNILINEIYKIFNDQSWKNELVYPFSDKDIRFPRIITTSVINGAVGQYEIEACEYSEKFFVVFAPAEFTSMVPENIIKENGYKNWTDPRGIKRMGVGMAKSSKNIATMKQFFATDFEAEYIVPKSGSSYAAPSPQAPVSPYSQPSFPQAGSIPTGMMIPAAPLPPKTFSMDMVSLFGRLRSVTGVEIEKVLSSTEIIYGEKAKVLNFLVDYEEYETLATFSLGEDKLAVYIKIATI